MQKSGGLGVNGFSAFQFWMPQILWVSIFWNTPRVILDSKVLMHIIQLPQRLFCNILFCFSIFAAQMIYDFLDHKGHIVGEIVFFSRNTISSKGTESHCNYLRALKSLKLQRHVDLRNLSRRGSVCTHILTRKSLLTETVIVTHENVHLGMWLLIVLAQIPFFLPLFLS